MLEKNLNKYLYKIIIVITKYVIHFTASELAKIIENFIKLVEDSQDVKNEIKCTVNKKIKVREVTPNISFSTIKYA